MKTIYLKQLKSGNYELSTRKDYTEKFTTKTALNEFFQAISKKQSNVFDNHYRKLKPCRIVKERYSQSQTYFSSFDELWKHLNK